jgi:hypothetical protein
MKMSRISILLFGAALAFSSATFAGEINKGTLRLDDKVVVDGKPLAPGNYRVEWDGSGPAVQVKLLQGKQAVATIPAHVTEEATPNSQDGYATTAEPNGSKALTTIYFKRFTLQIDQNQAGPQASN